MTRLAGETAGGMEGFVRQPAAIAGHPQLLA